MSALPAGGKNGGWQERKLTEQRARGQSEAAGEKAQLARELIVPGKEHLGENGPSPRTGLKALETLWLPTPHQALNPEFDFPDLKEDLFLKTRAFPCVFQTKLMLHG